ncbi:MAG: DUF3362 domain-containing protein, partial [Fluviibacter sp.]
LALWLKRNNFRLDQVQTFLPTPMALATTMYHTRKNPLRGLKGGGENVEVIREGRRRRLHKAFLRYHDPANWPMLREALSAMGRADLIGNGKKQLIPAWQPKGFENARGRAEPRTARDHVHAPTRQSVSPARKAGGATGAARTGTAKPRTAPAGRRSVKR